MFMFFWLTLCVLGILVMISLAALSIIALIESVFDPSDKDFWKE